MMSIGFVKAKNGAYYIDLTRLDYYTSGGESLAQNHGKDDRRAALDRCLSCPTDVSALWATSGDAERRGSGARHTP